MEIMTNKQIEYYSRLYEIHDSLKSLIFEFEIVYDDLEIKKKLPSAQWVYMHTIIISLWMILGTGKHDEFRLSKIKSLFPDKVIQDIADNIINKNTDLICKLGKNRNKISAHLDPNLIKLKFSDTHVDEFERRFKIRTPNLRAENRASERYSTIDMRNDLLEINQILEDVKKILNLIPKSV